MTDLAITSGEFTSFAHRTLWKGAQLQLTLADERPDDIWMLHLSAGLLGAAAFEAYLNYVGEEMLPHIWAQEKRFFSSPDYKGTRGKFKRVAEELGFSLPPPTHQPYAGWLELVSLRHKVVHARPKKTTYRATHKAFAFPKLPSGWLESETRPEKIRSLISDTETLAVELHSLVQKSAFRCVPLGSHPFIGLLGFGTRSVDFVG